MNQRSNGNPSKANLFDRGNPWPHISDMKILKTLSRITTLAAVFSLAGLSIAQPPPGGPGGPGGGFPGGFPGGPGGPGPGGPFPGGPGPRPPIPIVPIPIPHPRPPVEESDGHSLAVQVQRKLKRLGYYNGAVDGEVGRGTRAAIRVYQEENGLEANGQIDRPLLRSLGLL